LLCGRPPFPGKRKEDIYRAVKTAELSFAENPWPKISRNAIDFIIKALNRDKSARPSAFELLDHPWITSN
jgi:calcium-dependent protein kinase